jgi:hypothetical protein
MKHLRMISLGVAAWLAAGATLLAADSADGNKAELTRLFETALEARDLEYQKARDAILAHDGAADFLAERANDTNLISRVIGRAMQTWLRDRAGNMETSEHLAEVVRQARRSQIGERAILGRICVYEREPGLRRIFLKSKPEVHVLLEVALKGPTFPNEPRYLRNLESRFAINCYAAGLLGLYEDSDVVPVLTLLTNEKEDDLMRRAALCGFRLREDVDKAVFLKGLEDRNEGYRKSCYVYLRDTTGQDFGYDVEKYRTWLETNAVGKVAKPEK